MVPIEGNPMPYLNVKHSTDHIITNKQQKQVHNDKIIPFFIQLCNKAVLFIARLHCMLNEVFEEWNDVNTCVSAKTKVMRQTRGGDANDQRKDCTSGL